MAYTVLPEASRHKPALAGRQRVVIIDMAVAPDSPAGSCVLAEAQGLTTQFDVTVFSERFDAGDLPGVEFIRVRAPSRPVLLRYLAFHLGMPLHFLWWRLNGGRAVCVQATQGQLPGAAICYAHFCHGAYLKHHWRKSSVAGVRRWARYATHRFNAWFEASAMCRARCIVVPSQGLAREIAQEYPHCAAKLRVIANPVAIERFARPPEFDRHAQRASHGFDAQHLVLGFMALGDFARKGLGLLLDAIAALPQAQRASIRVLVVGGQPGEISEFAAWAARLDIRANVCFVGMQSDVRPFLWACDVFAFPSAYETFGLAVVQAAAAGLPVMVGEGLHGIEEFVVEGHNGWSVARDPGAIVAWLKRLLSEQEDLPRMSVAAVDSVQPYDRRTFQLRWAALIGGVVNGSGHGAPSAVDLA